MGNLNLLQNFFSALFLLLSAELSFCKTQKQLDEEWNARNYPNPTISNDFRRCGMKSKALICDPDAIFTENQRYRINYELHQMEQRTRQDHASDFCQKKGITTALAIARHIDGGSEYATKMLANEMKQRWNLDTQCSKDIAIVLVIDDRKYYFARDSRVPVYSSEFAEIFKSQNSLFQSGNYEQAILNILRALWEKALEKQQMPSEHKGGNNVPDQGDGIIPKFPYWFWIALMLIAIPLICCCCCCCVYFCCCRSKELSHQNGSHNNGGLLSASGALNSIGNLIRAKRPRDNQMHDYKHVASGGPQRGTYPSTNVKDEGVGGSW